MANASTHCIIVLESVLSRRNSSELSRLLYESRLFSQFNHPIISKAPLQPYFSALLFCPTESIVRKKFSHYLAWVVKTPVIDKSWGEQMEIITKHCGHITTFAISKDNRFLASAAKRNRRFMLWDMILGTLVHEFKGHTAYVGSLAFLQNDELASGSADGIINLWNIESRSLVRTLKDGEGSVEWIAVSRESCLVTASSDKNLGIRNASGNLLKSFKLDWPNKVEFLPNYVDVAAIDAHGLVQIWNVPSQKFLKFIRTTPKGACNWAAIPRAIAVSPDGSKLATALKPPHSSINIWEISSGNLLKTIKVSEGLAECSMVFSPDGEQIAYADKGSPSAITIWNISSDHSS
ncbi:hypothetical protein H072_4902 [Dactylellina haptotyla CBS 200.50]|uniref:Uncharacterized protein n=1 Tax=Dactylellina haptotyla (strain CBS 200.50) TaxID=1284197 RepID=S8C0M7_DACHA|nr:hypothetical protein H072_4902 [Dactylellina haptotyla CBS 200.50]